MTVKQCYEMIDGDLDSVVSRLGSEVVAARFLKKFLADDSFDKLAEGMEEGDKLKSFMAAHTLKGVCLNLGLGRLTDSSAALSDALKAEKDDVKSLFERVKRDYLFTLDCIKNID